MTPKNDWSAFALLAAKNDTEDEFAPEQGQDNFFFWF